MKNSKLILYALLNALGTVLYVLGVALFMSNIESIFGKFEKPDDFRAPLAMILMFVFSAAITAELVLGRPILLYLEGLKKEAVRLFLYTLAFIFIAILIVFFTLFI